jgi:hypothetical protein
MPFFAPLNRSAKTNKSPKNRAFIMIAQYLFAKQRFCAKIEKSPKFGAFFVARFSFYASTAYTAEK